MEDQLKEIATEEAQHLRELAKDGAKSGAYLYPVKVSSISFDSSP